VPTVSPALGHLPGGWDVVLLVVVAALPVLLATRLVLVRMPEPIEPEGKLAYGALPTHRFVAACTTLAALCAGVVALTLPPATWPLWWVLCAPALVLVAVDARTTWLPLALTRVVWAATVGAGALAALLGGAPLLGRSAVGAVAAALLYLLLWRLSRGGLGFGDVRLAPVLGAASAAAGWPTLFASLLLGSLVGAGVGIVLALRGRRGAFAYAPSMLAGAFLACGARALSG
jgi:leader peptidase (prepilin peptidase) / N-methyltransferase